MSVGAEVGGVSIEGESPGGAVDSECGSRGGDVSSEGGCPGRAVDSECGSRGGGCKQ